VSTPEVTAATSHNAADHASGGMHATTAYTLPVATLQQLAQQSQLEWVNSDPARVAAVQAAIAAEPAPVHVPRERPAQVATDEGPLILVETKRDLKQTVLAYEQKT
jgi:ribonuclease E